MKYDEQILLKGAQQFQAEGDTIVFRCALRYGFLSFLFTAFSALMLVRSSQTNLEPEFGYALVAAVTFFAVMCGIWRGRVLAFRFHLEAQRLLVLIEIEQRVRNVEMPISV